MSLSRGGWRLAVTSGKGGVGKTSVTVHLASALAAGGARVGIVDCDLALGNVDVVMGLSPQWHLGHGIAGDRRLSDILIDGPHGIRIAPAGSGVRSLTALDADQWQRLAAAFDDFAAQVDVLLLDTASGVSDTVLDVVGLADCALVVTNFDPAALVDAYALIKLIDALDEPPEVAVVVNAARKATDAETAFRQLSLVSQRFLGRTLRDAGAITHDPQLVRQGPAVTLLGAGPIAGARRGFQDLAKRLLQWAPTTMRPQSRVRPPRAADLAARLSAEVAPCA